MAHHLECCSSTHQYLEVHKRRLGLEEDLGFGFDVGFDVGFKVVEGVGCCWDILKVGGSSVEFVTARDD